MEEKSEIRTASAQGPADTGPAATGPRKIGRRDWLKAAVDGGAGLAVGSLIDLPTVRAQRKKLKLSVVSEFNTSCNFCSCGCGMIAAVRDGELVSMEGDSLKRTVGTVLLG